MNTPRLASLIAPVAGFAGLAAAQTITVNTVSDVFDIGAPHTIAQLPGLDGRVSLREALTAADNTPGPQTIAFAIPRSEWDERFFPGRAMIDLQGPLSINGDDTVVDFSTQTQFTGDTNPNGYEVGLTYYGPPSNFSFIYVFGHRNTIRGLDLTGGNAFGASVFIAGNDNLVDACNTSRVEINGNFGGPAASRNTVRNSTLAEVAMLCWADDNVVIGNRLTHARIEGSQYCVYPQRNRLGGPDPAERNVISGYGRYGEEGFPTGSQVDVVWAQGTIIEGNYVGTTTDGMARQPQIGPGGITVRDAINTTIRGNLIAGLRTVGGNHYAGQVFGDAIAVTSTNADTVNTVIMGNTIGLAADGVTTIPTRRGITITPATARQRARNVTIGGVGDGEGNTIAGVESFGIFLGSLESGTRISGNRVFACGAFPIELVPASGSDGPTPNDPFDADSGANGLQNFPLLAAAETQTSGTRVRGTLNSLANQQFTVEVFASAACLSSGRGEAGRFLGTVSVVTDGSGVAAFDALLPAPTAPGEYLAATAIRFASGDTSEIGPCLPVEVPPCRPDFNADGTLDADDLGDFINCYFSTPACPGADFNADGTSDADDLGDFINAYFAGCS